MNWSPAVSRVKKGTIEEGVLVTAAKVALSEGKPVTIVHGYDRDKIGAYTEVTFWHQTDKENSFG